MNLNLTRQRRAATPAALSAVRQAPAVMPFSGGELLNSELESSESRGSLKLALLYDYFFAGKITQSLSLYRFCFSNSGAAYIFPFFSNGPAHRSRAGPGPSCVTSKRPISKSWWGQGKQQEPRSELRAQPRPRGRRRRCWTRMTATPQSRLGWSRNCSASRTGSKAQWGAGWPAERQGSRRDGGELELLLEWRAGTSAGEDILAGMMIRPQLSCVKQSGQCLLKGMGAGAVGLHD